MDKRFEIGNVFSPACLDPHHQKMMVSYMEKLRKKDAHALGFLPWSAFEENIQKNRVIIETENGEPCGFLIWSKMKIRAKILMCCIQDDSRREFHATNLLRGMLELKDAWDVLYMQLRCADDLESNKFWRRIGFGLVTQMDGGKMEIEFTKARKNSIEGQIDKLLIEDPLIHFTGARIKYRLINVWRQWIKGSKYFALQSLENRLRFFTPQAG